MVRNVAKEFDDQKRQQEIEDTMSNMSCVADMLASVTGSFLTKPQKERRAAQIIDQPQFTDTGAFRQVAGFVRSIREEYATPAGQELAKMEIGISKLTAQEIRKRTAEGAKVAVATTLTRTHKGHIAQVSPNGQGFIQNEDPDLPLMHLKEGKPYRAIIFVDKK